MQDADLDYAGFWARAAAALIDIGLVVLIAGPLLAATDDAAYRGAGLLLGWMLAGAAAVRFWALKQATPGKMVISARIIDAKSGERPTTRQFVVRYISYLVAIVPFGLGVVWIALDRRKQGWHDKIAGTVVVRWKSRRARRHAYYRGIRPLKREVRAA